jgi:hypothetical protein
MNLPDALGQAPTSREELNPLSICSLLCGEQGEESAEPVAGQNWTVFGYIECCKPALRNPIEKDFHNVEQPFLLSQCSWRDL